MKTATSIGLIIIAIVIYLICYLNSEDDIVIKVKSKESTVFNSGESLKHKYIIFTENETFECTDSYMFSKFNSSDVYSKFDKDRVYNVKVAGWRIPFLSWYRNIISINDTSDIDIENILDTIR